MKKLRALVLLPLATAAFCHVRLFTGVSRFADAHGVSPLAVLGGNLWNNLLWLTLALTFGAISVAVLSSIDPYGDRPLILASGLCAAGGGLLFALMEWRARAQLAVNGLPYVFDGVNALRLGLYLCLGFAFLYAMAVVLTWREKA